MYAVNRMLGLIALAAVVGSCGAVEAQVIRGGAPGAGKPCPKAPGAGRQPGLVGISPIPSKSVAPRQPQVNVGSGNGGGAAKRLASIPQTIAPAKPHAKEEEKHHGEHQKKHKEEVELAKIEHEKLKHKKHLRHEEVVGTHVVGEELVGGPRIVGEEDVVVAVPKYFKTDSVWVGTREHGAEQWAVHLLVKSVDGNSFKGILSQRSASGDLERQRITGEVDGDTFTFSTCGVLEGTRSPLAIDGYFAENEMRADVSGRGNKSDEDLGTMTLVREGTRVAAR